jgi:hypothetical protein
MVAVMATKNIGKTTVQAVEFPAPKLSRKEYEKELRRLQTKLCLVQD